MGFLIALAGAIVTWIAIGRYVKKHPSAKKKWKDMDDYAKKYGMPR